MDLFPMALAAFALIVVAVLAYGYFDNRGHKLNLAAIHFGLQHFDSLKHPLKGLITEDSLRAAKLIASGEDKRMIQRLIDRLDAFGHPIDQYDTHVPVFTGATTIFVPSIAYVYAVSREDLAKAKAANPHNVVHW
jgi:hypothetical protein